MTSWLEPGQHYCLPAALRAAAIFGCIPRTRFIVATLGWSPSASSPSISIFRQEMSDHKDRDRSPRRDRRSGGGGGGGGGGGSSSRKAPAERRVFVSNIPFEMKWQEVKDLFRDEGKFQFAIDRGGTFTDVFARCPSGKLCVMKLLSVNPEHYADAPTEGIRRILAQESENGAERFKPNKPVDASEIAWIRMGTTVATNALLERKGEKAALLITKGFKDLLYIGNQTRPHLFDISLPHPQLLYDEVVELDERVILHDDRCELGKTFLGPEDNALTQETVHKHRQLDVEALKVQLSNLKEKGIKSLGVVLIHSYLYPKHEEQVGEVALTMGFEHISLSSKIMPMIKMVPRGHTAMVDAYLTPCIQLYLSKFASGFQANLKDVRVTFMQSDGGLTPMQLFNGSRAIISGPAGGVIGYSRTTPTDDSGVNSAVVGFDMGGTSTDVSRFDGHNLEHVFESVTAGIVVQAPQLDVNTVAAGGGSRLFFRSGLFVVGPESAGADPGPVCYRKGGHLTVTDANLCLGRILPDFFPKIFGPNEDEPLDRKASMAAFETLTNEINDFLRSQDNNCDTLSTEEVAMGFIRVANESMCRPIRALTQGKGHDSSKHTLACFGGAGGQHACAIAKSLGMNRVFVHKYAGILSAYGMALADVVHETQRPLAKSYCTENFKAIDKMLDELEDECVKELMKQGFPQEMIETQVFLHMRYDNTDCSLMITPADTEDSEEKSTGRGDFLSSFIVRYKTEFGFALENRTVVVDDVRVRGIGKTRFQIEPDIEVSQTPDEPRYIEETNVYFEDTGLVKTKIYMWNDLLPKQTVVGPAIIMNELSTLLVEPDCKGLIDVKGNLTIEIELSGSSQRSKVTTALDTIQLSIFSHRFMSIAEQMGRILQRTSISTNIKERLDFSCALFGPDGGLVSNAPHIPVHLGAMQDTVRHQMKVRHDDLHKGDVLLANHPKAGGSHLPDLTVITPVFYKGEEKPVFFVANRGHHADIGGVTPGSMPPHSKQLWEEGAAFKSFKLVDRGKFNEQALIDKFKEPAKYPNSSGSRCLQDNISDLKAQIAANQKGIALVSGLIEQYGLDVVQAYMTHIQENAEVAVRDMLKGIGEAVLNKDRKNFEKSKSNKLAFLSAKDYMDDGSLICLEVSINTEDGSALFDFTKSGPQVWGNSNTPRAVVFSALIYSLRCMVGHDIPLNQGCMVPVEVRIEPGSILDPDEDAAVVGGNVLTSQRIVDVIFKAFKAAAASQGCCNNVTFGDENFGYYETVAGGSGATKASAGRSGVHVHMTNTRLTDPEVLERRYPVILDHFSLAPNTGGMGVHKGGDGVQRNIRFRKPLKLSILTERRVLNPYGLEGGEDGARGVNLLQKGDRTLYLGGKNAVDVNAGDVFKMRTPGGGGWGKLSEHEADKEIRAEALIEKFGDKFVEKGSLYDYQQRQLSA